MLIDEINIDKKIHLMSDFISDNEYKSLKGSDLIINLCQKINANVYLAGDGASKYDNINNITRKIYHIKRAIMFKSISCNLTEKNLSLDFQ